MCQFNCDVSVIQDREVSFVMADMFVVVVLCHTRFLQSTGAQKFPKQTSRE